MSFDLKIVNGDISINSNGDISFVSGNAKLRQDIIKIILTDLGDNKFHSKYGSRFGSLGIGEITDQGLIEGDLKSSIIESLNYLIALQKNQSQRQILSPSEILLQILDVKIERDFSDPRMYSAYISILTQKLEQISEAITIRLV
jgi:hypothetical protein